MELNNLTIKEAHGLLTEKQISAKDLAESVLGAIKSRDADIHAYLEVFGGDAIAEALALDARIAEGDHISMLAGIPLAIKDNILIKGKRVSAASRMLETYRASYDATVIERLKKEGALFVGRTNMDEFAMGSSTENSAFGATKNPHDTSRVPGGSSGGSAAAVAAFECLAALGSDTGGSIRQPAALCGVVGLKPTYGSVSRSGLIAMASSLDQIGPITRSVEDAEIVFDAIRGHDPLDSTTSERAYEKETKPLQQMRLGVPKEYFVGGLDPEIKQTIEAAIEIFQNQGVAIEEVSLPHTEHALSVYYVLMPAEVSANLARFDGIRYGLSEPADKLFDVYAKTRERGFGPEARRRIILGSYVLSAGYYDAYYTKAQKVRALIRKDFESVFERVDAIISPTTPTTAFRFGEKTNDPLSMYLEDIYTVPANLAGVPALSIPAGFSKEKLPIGLQLMGRIFDEGTLFALGKAFESAKQ
ncbi:MAG: aspartyl/glutamyl-tRNA amidotransferase subunit A [Candidatus Ryanbacteria bacterium RIFCSPHIGHO2_02_FULL_48_12]|uniref:Glutamyl-tRNA(Gln) amidotransferase subunit A n=1 Tax=Candidatus Ryanbacteria bacterium RIFCSPHIGHO2_01_FULL_48_27 TaxID=1802115 RepID=A0A1G2G7B9_9BACT|nr:MAG: aspartyl/glutamyl-tRNA amidotransferase subunit A [Candidatus Ryanbacteria bacterium RIFCSPHIGHO2_01_FULL_48_27]OGZ49460.1 MAG: aspartyl/glutamyl-tRNA amidotransferase subunit A [Candidatus Ryanbacteria bacterium RIFCSPHIGHO2_02_FULL_48_12]